MSVIDGLSIDQLRQFLENFAKNWLAHDGVWFQAVEAAHGLEAAVALDAFFQNPHSGMATR